MKSSKRWDGFSLIEILVSLAVVVFVMLALLEAVALYTQQSMINILRDEGVRATQDVLYNLRTQDYDAAVLSVGSHGALNAKGQCTTPAATVTKRVRTATWTFNVCWVITEDANHTRKTVTGTSSWSFLQSTFTHEANIVVSK